MKFELFSKSVDLSTKSEIEKIIATLFYFKEINGKDETTIKNLTDFLENHGFPKINIYRLKNKIRSSRDIVKGKVHETVKLSHKALIGLKNTYPDLNQNDELIIASETILPNSLFLSTRGYIEKLCLQINGCYENNYYDACAVCMRRLLEILLILTYQKGGKANEIQEKPNEYKNLNFIINFTKSNNHFHLSKGTLDTMDTFRVIGNFSAHKIEYNCRPKEINDIRLDFRTCIEELLYKSGIN